MRSWFAAHLYADWEQLQGQLAIGCSGEGLGLRFRGLCVCLGFSLPVCRLEQLQGQLAIGCSGDDVVGYTSKHRCSAALIVIYVGLVTYKNLHSQLPSCSQSLKGVSGMYKKVVTIELDSEHRLAAASSSMCQPSSACVPNLSASIHQPHVVLLRLECCCPQLDQHSRTCCQCSQSVTAKVATACAQHYL